MNSRTFAAPGICCATLLAVTTVPAAGGEALPSSRMESAGFGSGGSLRGATLDLAELVVRTVTLAPGASGGQRVDADGYEELLIVRDGELSVGSGDGAAVVGPGSALVTHPGGDRAIANAGDEPVTFYQFIYRTHRPQDAERGRAAGGSFVVDWDDVEFVPSGIGGRRQMFDRATAMFDRFEMHVSTLNGGLTNHPAHTHRAEEFVLVVEGQVAMLIGENTVEAGPGDLIYVESMIPPSLDNVGEDAATYFAFQHQP